MFVVFDVQITGLKDLELFLMSASKLWNQFIFIDALKIHLNPQEAQIHS